MMASIESYFRLLACWMIAWMGLASLAQEAKAAEGFLHRPGERQFAVAGNMSCPLMASDALGGARFSVRGVSWETRWFQGALIFVCAGGLVVCARRIVSRAVRARLEELEEKMVLEGERVRIARGMHDHLSASLMQITVAAEMARICAPTESPAHIQRIASLARHAVEASEEIVWMVNPGNDVIDSAVEYFGQYAIDFLAAANIACELDIPFDLPRQPFSIGLRHHLLMAIKEALNNVVKYASARTVHFEVQFGEGSLLITIADDGQGFAIGDKRARSDGLRNMSSRMAELGGTCRVESRPGAGTWITFEMRLPGKSS